MENSKTFPENLKVKLPYVWSSTSTSGYLSERNKKYYLKNISASLFTTVKTLKQHICPLMSRKYIYIYIIQSKNKENSNILYNMSGLWRHCGK